MALATNSTPGSIVLAGDLTGVAAAPELRVSGVVPGSYDSPSLVVDAKGRIIYAKSKTQLQGDLTGIFNSNTLSTTGVTAGTYEYPSITVNSSGRLTKVTGNTFTLAGDLVGVRIGSAVNTTLRNVVNAGTYFHPTITVNQSGLIIAASSNESNSIVQLTTSPPDSNADLYFTPAPTTAPLTVGLTLPSDPQLQSFDIIIKPRDGLYVSDFAMRSAIYNGSRYVSLCNDVDSTGLPGISRVTQSIDGKWWKTLDFTVAGSARQFTSFRDTTNYSSALIGPGGNLYVIDSHNNTTFISPDGLNWTPTSVGPPDPDFSWVPSEVRWNGSVFCVIGYAPSLAGTTTSMRTSSNGIDWTSFTPSYSNGSILFYSNQLLVNPTGVFCAISTSANYTMTSSDGYNWVYTPVGEISSANSFVCGTHNSTFIVIAYYPTPAIAGAGNSTVLISGDGRNWSRASYPFATEECYSIASNGSLVCATHRFGNQIAVSTNGITWEVKGLPFTMLDPIVTSANGVFFITSSSAPGPMAYPGNHPDSRPVMCLSSTDCVNWTILANPSPIQTEILPAPGFKFSNSQDGMKQILTCTRSEDEFFCTYQ